MSHHLDCPISRQDARLDLTDLFVFRGEHGTVFVMDACHSIAGDDVPKGFHPEALYEFKIDGDGDAVEDLTYRFTFGERDAEGGQDLELRRLTGAEVADPDASGAPVAHGATRETVMGEDGLRMWAGQAGDPFWIEPDVLEAVGKAFTYGTKADLSSWRPAEAKNLFAGHTVYSIVLEVPDSVLMPYAAADHRIGVWALSTLATDSGGWQQINRVGHPMIHPLFAQIDEQLGNKLNLGRPADDLETHGKTVENMVAGVVGAYGSAEDPQNYGRVFAERVLPNVLPYTIGTRAIYGFAEWNGRSMNDNAPDVMFSLAGNTPISIGITQESITSKPSRTFPYVPSVS